VIHSIEAAGVIVERMVAEARRGCKATEA